jgi:hypothetical protein
MDGMSLLLGLVAGWFFLKGPGSAMIASTTSIATGYGPDPTSGPATNMPAGGAPGAPTGRAAQAGDSGANTPVQVPSGGGAPDPQVKPGTIDNIGNYTPPGYYGRGYGNWGNGTPYDKGTDPTRYTPIYKPGPESVSSAEYNPISSNGGMVIGSGYR